jgi:hypothetical protein
MDLVEGNFTPVDFKSAAAKARSGQRRVRSRDPARLLPTPAGGHRRNPAVARPGVPGENQDAAGHPGSIPTGRRPPQAPGHRPAGNRRRRHRQRPPPSATRHALLVVPIPQGVHGMAAGDDLALSLSGCQDDPPPRPKDRAAEIEAARREREAVRQSEDRRSHYKRCGPSGSWCWRVARSSYSYGSTPKRGALDTSATEVKWHAPWIEIREIRAHA